ncbi:hypothetical protein [Spiroplasma clarkii]|uniref:Uncharacterized protein n=1 Tax=Spiroplasma clarkii TaxID=2139 RepID=A0A2K8KKW3_9MOLU|nr:hypothetical protein [Spiroplasma clarkii]ATX71139.1 hypothetical protein SCLAR_v1c08310 [Spiroplasma clarkii]
MNAIIDGQIFLNDFYGILTLIPIVIYSLTVISIQVMEKVYKKYLLRKRLILVAIRVFCSIVAIILLILALML